MRKITEKQKCFEQRIEHSHCNDDNVTKTKKKTILM